MHIGSGLYEGKVLKNPADSRSVSCRALTIKEVIFSFIGTRLIEGTVLDVNDSNGMFGIESLSRGASACRFVNPEKAEAKIIEENLRDLKIKSAETVFNENISEYLENPLNQDIAKEKYDVIFFDIRESGEFDLVNDVFKKQKKSGITALIFPNLIGFNIPNVEDGEIFETREFEDRKVALLVKKEK